LSRGGAQITQTIAQSIRATVNQRLTPEEKLWIDRIEQLRSAMNGSSEKIIRTDYGAGSPDADRTKEEMQSGFATDDSIGNVSRVASKPPFWCGLLFKLLRDMRPASCIEMGTAVGISASYQAAALKMNGHGRLVTLEGAAALANIARANFQQLGLETVEVVVGRFQETLPDVLAQRRPVDYLFVDGHHDEQATLGYFEAMLPFLGETALLAFDDIDWSDGMKRAWQTIAHDSRVGVAVDLGPVGLCGIARSVIRRNYFDIPLV
jgi:predicted O-methyltransferase YrrM